MLEPVKRKTVVRDLVVKQSDRGSSIAAPSVVEMEPKTERRSYAG
jgi:hypothetical protein